MSIKLYQEELMDHFKNPRNYGKIENPDFSAEDNNPSCGDRVCVEGSISNGFINRVGFEGQGCVLSQSTASMLTEYLKNKTIDEASEISEKDVLGLIGLSLGPVRMKCALLSFKVFKEGIKRVL